MLLYVREAAGDYRPARHREIFESARACAGQRFAKGRAIASPADAAELFAAKLGGLEAERFAALFLDHGHRVIAYEELFFGTLDTATVHPREVLKRALHHNAAAVIFGHNHPSGSTVPSDADTRITRRLQEALALLEIRVLDHLVIGDGHTSLSERGEL